MSASRKNQQGFSPPEVMLAMVLMVMIVTALSVSGINEQSCQQKPVPTALAAWLAANATARDFATRQLAGQPNADIAGGGVSISVTLVSPGAEKAR